MLAACTPPGDGGDPLLTGHALMGIGEYQEALDAYHAAAATRGLTADVLSAIGSANLQLGRLGQAESALRLAVERDPAFVPAWNNLGVTLYQRDELYEAREVFRLAFALDKGNATEIRDNLRLVDEKIQNIDQQDAQNPNFRLVRQGNGQYLLVGI